MLDRTQRRRAGAAAVAADQDNVGVRLRHASRDRAHADFGHQFHGNAGMRIDVFQIVDQLREIFDRIDVVMRRRRNQADAGNGMAHARDHLVDFVAGKLAAFAGLGALRHLDLQFVGIHEVVRGDAETRGSHLLDGAAPQIAVGVAAGNALRLLRPRRYWICRRCGSWRWPAFRALLC